MGFSYISALPPAFNVYRETHTWTVRKCFLMEDENEKRIFGDYFKLSTTTCFK